MTVQVIQPHDIQSIPSPLSHAIRHSRLSQGITCNLPRTSFVERGVGSRFLEISPHFGMGSLGQSQEQKNSYAASARLSLRSLLLLCPLWPVRCPTPGRANTSVNVYRPEASLSATAIRTFNFAQNLDRFPHRVPHPGRGGLTSRRPPQPVS